MKTDSVLTVRDYNANLTIDQLAEALYEGTPHLQNLAEKLARQHGKAGALTFYSMMSEEVRNFWRGLAKQMIDHAAEWAGQPREWVYPQRQRTRSAESIAESFPMTPRYHQTGQRRPHALQTPAGYRDRCAVPGPIMPMDPPAGFWRRLVGHK